MPERTVKLGSMFYIDEDGKGRRGDCGEKIQVSSDFVKRFDALNHLASVDDAQPIVAIAPEAVEAAKRPEPEPEAPKRRGRPAKKADPA
jgi:hypothetical protein